MADGPSCAPGGLSMESRSVDWLGFRSDLSLLNVSSFSWKQIMLILELIYRTYYDDGWTLLQNMTVHVLKHTACICKPAALIFHFHSEAVWFFLALPAVPYFWILVKHTVKANWRGHICNTLLTSTNTSHVCWTNVSLMKQYRCMFYTNLKGYEVTVIWPTESWRSRASECLATAYWSTCWMSCPLLELLCTAKLWTTTYRIEHMYSSSHSRGQCNIVNCCYVPVLLNTIILNYCTNVTSIY